MHIVCILCELLALFLSHHLDYLYSVTAGNSAGSVDSLWTLATTQEGGEGRRRREKEGRWEEGIGEGMGRRYQFVDPGQYSGRR